MSDVKIAAVTRAGAYSPNNVCSDAAILNGVVEQLRKRSCEVRVYSEEQLIKGEVKEDVIINMCREWASIKLLQQLEPERLIINSGYGIENCTRERMTRILVGGGIPYPESIIVDTDEKIFDRLRESGFKSAWVKRGDFHAMHKEDVSYVRHAEEAQEVLQEYFLRGIRRAVINKHLKGDLIKFYGIRGAKFFYWFYPYDNGHSKFGLDAINGHSKGLEFDRKYLYDICQKAAELLDVVVFGGDCIVEADGTVSIIDFNDWPSFAPCREEASLHIAKVIFNMIKQRNDRG